MTRRGRLGVRLAALACVSGLLGGCTPASNAIGPPESSKCLLAIAASRAAVHGRGRYAGVRYVSARSLAADLKASTELKALKKGQPPRHRVPPALAAVRSAVCVVAWRGSFDPHAVRAGWPPRHRLGRLAIVVVRQHDVHVVVTLVLDHPPLALARMFPHLLETPLLR